MGAFMDGGVIVNQDKRVVIIGDKVIPFHEKMTGMSITTINKRCYIDGYEYKNGKWKKTLMGLWHKMF